MFKSGRCSACTKHQKTLSTTASRIQTDDQTHPSSHTTYSSLNTPEKDERLRCIHNENVRLKSQLAWLREKISAAINNSSVTVDSELEGVVGEPLRRYGLHCQKCQEIADFSAFYTNTYINLLDSLIRSRPLRHTLYLPLSIYVF